MEVIGHVGHILMDTMTHGITILGAGEVFMILGIIIPGVGHIMDTVMDTDTAMVMAGMVMVMVGMVAVTTADMVETKTATGHIIQITGTG